MTKSTRKNITIVVLIVAVAIAGFFVYSKVLKSTTNVSSNKAAVSLSPIFSKLSTWVPAATWESPQKSTETTLYGELTGMQVSGEIKDTSLGINDNFGNDDIMTGLGYTKDIKFSADGPGASNWGYIKTENGRSVAVLFSYSTELLLGPENTGKPFINLSVFVSDPFQK